MLRRGTLSRAALILALLLWASPAAADGIAPGTACTSGTYAATTSYGGNNEWCNGSTYQYPAYQFGASSATCNGTNAGIIRWTGSIFQVCNGSSWQALPVAVANAYGQTMVSSWPDAISCNVTSPSQGTTIFYAALMPYSGDSLYYYRYSSGGTNYDIKYTSAGAFSAYNNLTTTTCNVSITTLYSNGQAFNFVNGTSQASYSPTVPAGSGYFVLTGTTYNGNLGGRSGADASCLTELATTNTGWKGYSTANSNGQLVASKVHAFLCDSNGCNNLMPLTTYYFANAGNSSAGGASFTTDSSGNGPGDSANWSAANYFSGAYSYWTNMGIGSSTAWNSSPLQNNGSTCPYGWNNSGSGNAGEYAQSANTNASRWGNYGFTQTCNNTLNLICFVNP